MPDFAELPIFPLSNVVLFPQVQVPLHLFEPRYRQMAADVLDRGGRIGMVVVRPEHLTEMAGKPPVFPIGCAGRITASQKLEDGRYNIVLAGEARFRIVDEPEGAPERLYRVARVEPLEDRLDDADVPRVAALRERVVELVGDLVRLTAPEQAQDLPQGFLRDTGDVPFVNALCNALAFAPAEKQGLLDADSIVERFERLTQLLAFRVAELGAAGSPSSGSVH
jgi:Lon protease-like protein